MLRLHGAGLLHERLLTFKREYRLRGHAGLGTVPRSVGGVVVVGEVEDIFKVGGVSFSGDAVLMSHRLEPVDHLDWRAAGERGHRAERGCSYEASEWLIQPMSHSTAAQVQKSFKIYLKRSQIQRINISNNILLPVLQWFTVGLDPVAPCIFRWGLQQCENHLDSIRSPAWLSGTGVLYRSWWSCIHMRTEKLSLWS